MLAVEREGRVLVATLSRPPVNAIDAALLARLDAVIDEAEADAEQRDGLPFVGRVPISGALWCHVQ